MLPIALTNDMRLSPLSWSSWLQLSITKARHELLLESLEKLRIATPIQAIIIPTICTLKLKFKDHFIGSIEQNTYLNLISDKIIITYTIYLFIFTIWLILVKIA